jgi:hypothetical protein
MQFWILLIILVLGWAFIFPEAAIALLIRIKRHLWNLEAKRDSRDIYQDALVWFRANKHNLPKHKARLLKDVLENDKENFIARLTEWRETELINDEPIDRFFG